MAQVIWQPEAISDLEQIYNYLYERIPATAGDKIYEIYESAGRLKNFPLSGRIIPEFDTPEKREIIHYPYRVMYEVIDDEVHITTVIHGAMDFKPE